MKPEDHPHVAPRVEVAEGVFVAMTRQKFDRAGSLARDVGLSGGAQAIGVAGARIPDRMELKWQGTPTKLARGSEVARE